MKPKYRRPLNPKQKQILLALYKFRFGTLGLLHTYQGTKSVTATSSRMKILVEQEFLGRNYDGHYRIQGKPATYYLRPRALKWLKTQPQVAHNVVKAIYNNDKRASEAFIAHNLAIFRLYLQLRDSGFKFFTKSELVPFDYLPKPLPDTYLTRQNRQDQLINDIFVSYISEGLPYFVIRKRFKQMTAYYETDDWEITGYPLPAWLIVCQTDKLVVRLTKNLAKLLDDDFELSLFVCSSDKAGDIKQWRPLAYDTN